MTKQHRLGLVDGMLIAGAATVVGATAISALAYRAATHMSPQLKQKGQQLAISENTDADNAWYLKQLPTERRIVTADGLTLRASYIAPKMPSHQAVILAHGIGHSREQMIPYARLFHDWGYHVLMPDARAHGDSDGHVIGFGWPDRKDYVQWIESLVSELGDSVKIVLFGISMGAATVLATAGEPIPDNVKAVVADSGFASVYKMAQHVVHHDYHLPAFPFVPIADRISQLMTGTRFLKQDVTLQLAKAKVPILFIHGRQDTVVPFDQLELLLNAVGGSAEVYVEDKAPHVKAFAQNNGPYRAKLQQFLNQTLNAD
ncbi:alpha/beta hydrolase [Secundilactobacillus kimchicus]|nr:alpha/beta hydrolase [Secundilactobacillus kimchicus]